MSYKKGAIGIFDSGYGGLSVFKEIKKLLPEYDYIYLGDNARVPYGTRSFDTVYEFTRQCVFKLFDLGCNLVILACNTASAKASKNIQKKDLPPGKKVLGVIRPTTEIIHTFTQSNKIGILATQGTVKSESYLKIGRASCRERVESSRGDQGGEGRNRGKARGTENGEPE